VSGRDVLPRAQGGGGGTMGGAENRIAPSSCRGFGPPRRSGGLQPAHGKQVTSSPSCSVNHPYASMCDQAADQTCLDVFGWRSYRQSDPGVGSFQLSFLP
jgi:hypothetical protein